MRVREQSLAERREFKKKKGRKKGDAEAWKKHNMQTRQNKNQSWKKNKITPKKPTSL